MPPLKVALVGSETSSQPKLYKSSSYEPTLNNMDLVKSIPASEMKAYYENPIRMACPYN